MWSCDDNNKSLKEIAMNAKLTSRITALFPVLNLFAGRSGMSEIKARASPEVPEIACRFTGQDRPEILQDQDGQRERPA